MQCVTGAPRETSRAFEEKEMDENIMSRERKVKKLRCQHLERLTNSCRKGEASLITVIRHTKGFN